MSLAPRRMMPSHSWSVPGRKPGTSTKVSTGMLNASQVRTKRAAFSEASMSRRAGELHRLVGHDADRAALDPAEADDDVRREQRLHLEELAVVEDVLDDRVHVVGLVGRVRDERVELAVGVGDRPGRPRRPTTGGSSRLLDGR